MKYIDCQKYAQEILDEVKATPVKGKLVIITVGEDPASQVYVKGKIRDCEYCGIPVEHIKIEEGRYVRTRLRMTILKYNADPKVAGIILQLPLPAPLNGADYCKMIDPRKDVDGLGSDRYFQPCTPRGIVHLMKKELGDLIGKNVLIIGRSNLVGKPLAKMLTDEDCTVTLAHSKTTDPVMRMNDADVVVSAIGKANRWSLYYCANADMVIDVGINRDTDGKLCGDFCGFDEDEFGWMKVTPVPKGVGLLTRAMLMKNVAEASERMVSGDVKQG